jgi:uncharacterized protein (TIGR02118 family)
VIKVIFLLTRHEDLTHDEFVHWWLGEHLQLASCMPHVRDVRLNVVDEGYDDSGVDGVGELWFDSHADMEAAYSSEAGQAVTADALAHMSARRRLIVTEHIFDEQS